MKKFFREQPHTVVLSLLLVVIVAFAAFIIISKPQWDWPEYTPPPPKIYYCDECIWNGTLSECDKEVHVEYLSTEYNLLTEQFEVKTVYYRYYYCPDCGEEIYKCFAFKV